MSNIAPGTGRIIFGWGVAQSMACFDKLPKAARVALTQCTLAYTPKGLATQMRKRGIKAAGASEYILMLDQRVLKGKGRSSTKNVYTPDHPQAGE